MPDELYSPDIVDVNPKNFKIDELTLINSSGETIDVRFLLTEFSIYEDLYSPVVTATLMLNDATNVLMNGPIFGFDQCKIQFGAIDKEIIDMTFEIYKVTDRFLIKERQMSYELQLIAKEKIEDSKIRVSKSYKGKLVSEIVEDLHGMISTGSIDIEDTKNTHHFIIPNWHPQTAINWLATLAKSSRYEGANFMYWQDHYGFHFETIESKMEQEAVIIYVHQPANARVQDIEDGLPPREYNLDVRSVQDYEIVRQIDVLKNIDTGMYGNTVHTHNWSTKKYGASVFDYKASFDDYVHLYQGNYLFSNANPDGRNSPQAMIKFHSTGSEPYPLRPDEWLGVRVSQMQQLDNIKVNIVVPGDSERVPAEVVELDLPSPESLKENQQVMDKHLRGKFLVTSVRHIVNQSSYICKMELTKESTYESLD